MANVISHQKAILVKPSLLIVDDEMMIRKTMTRILKKEGYGVKSKVPNLDDAGNPIPKNRAENRRVEIIFQAY